MMQVMRSYLLLSITIIMIGCFPRESGRGGSLFYQGKIYKDCGYCHEYITPINDDYNSYERDSISYFGWRFKGGYAKNLFLDEGHYDYYVKTPFWIKTDFVQSLNNCFCEYGSRIIHIESVLNSTATLEGVNWLACPNLIFLHTHIDKDNSNDYEKAGTSELKCYQPDTAFWEGLFALPKLKAVNISMDSELRQEWPAELMLVHANKWEEIRYVDFYSEERLRSFLKSLGNTQDSTLRDLRVRSELDSFYSSRNLPEEVAKLRNLRCLKLLGGPSEWILPPSFDRLDSLRTLSMKLDLSDSSTVAQLAGLPKLNKLAFYYEEKPYPLKPIYLDEQLGSLVHLDELVYKRPVKCILPETFKNLQNLKQLDIHIDGQRPEQWEIVSKLKNLTELRLNDFRDNRLWVKDSRLARVRIPESIVNLKQLKEFVYKGSAKCILPDNLKNLYELKYLTANIDIEDSSQVEMLSDMRRLGSITLNAPLSVRQVKKFMVQLNMSKNVNIANMKQDAYTKEELQNLDAFIVEAGSKMGYSVSNRLTLEIWLQEAEEKKLGESQDYEAIHILYQRPSYFR